VVHQCAPHSRSAQQRIDGEVVDPTAMTFVSGHDGADEGVVDGGDEKVFGVVGEFELDIALGIVEADDEFAVTPQVDDLGGVVGSKGANSEHDVVRCGEVRWREGEGRSGAERGEEGRVAALEVFVAGLGEDAGVSDEIVGEHGEAIFEAVVEDIAFRFDFAFFHTANAVGEAPAVALADGGAEAIHDGEAFFVTGTDVSEEFAGEFFPEVIEEIFDAGGGAAVVIGGPEEESDGVVDGIGDLFIGVGVAAGLGLKMGRSSSRRSM
jgi:hypothetical protein